VTGLVVLEPPLNHRVRVPAGGCPVSAPDAIPGSALTRWPVAPDPADVYINLALDLEPVSKSRARISPAEYTQIGAARIKVKEAHGYTGARLRDYENKIGWLLRQAGVRLNDVDDLGVHAIFHVRGNQRRDIDNLLKALLDACTGVAWRDDSQLTRITSEMIRASDHPRTELAVFVVCRRGQGCARCGTALPIGKISNKSVYCSKACYDAEQQRGAYRECFACGTTVYRQADKAAAERVFCSPECRAAGRGNCRNCGEPNVHPWSTDIFCSTDCAAAWHRKKPLASKAVPGICLGCSGPTSSTRAKLCRACHIVNVAPAQPARRLSVYDRCPECGGRKRSISALCAKCSQKARSEGRAGRWKKNEAALGAVTPARRLR